MIGMFANFFGGMWIKILIILSIVAVSLGVILKMQSDAKKAGRLVERAEQRKQNAKIRKLQEAIKRPNHSNIGELLGGL
jgi:uncharacterized membrane protein